jgi:hypothetical protein
MRSVSTAIVILGCALVAMAQPRRDYSLFTDPGKRFSVEFPRDWRWAIISPAGEALATFVEKDGKAAVIVERFRLDGPVAPEDITDSAARIEVKYIQEGQPRATIIGSRIDRPKTGPVIVIDYSRPGSDGSFVERVRQYSRPVGQNLYRITCSSIENLFKNYERTFITMVETLKPAVDP